MLFRWRVLRGAGKESRFLASGDSREPGDAEIDHHGGSVGLNKDVARLEIPVNNSPFVGALNGGAHCGRETQLSCAIVWVTFDPTRKRNAFNQFHGEEWKGRMILAFMDAGIKDSDNSGMIELAEQFDLAHEAGPEDR